MYTVNELVHSFSFWIGFYLLWSLQTAFFIVKAILQKTILSDPGKKAMFSMALAPIKVKLKKPAPIALIALIYLVLAPILYPIILFVLAYVYLVPSKRRAGPIIDNNVEKTNPDEAIEFTAPE